MHIIKRPDSQKILEVCEMGECGCKRRCSCMPKCCKKRCVGTFTDTYKMYETCCYDMVKVCSCCGQEYDHRRYPACPCCGGHMMYGHHMYGRMMDPPRFGGRGFREFGEGREFGRFSEFGERERFGRRRPEFEEEEEEEEEF